MAGEAGVGKTCLMDELSASTDAVVLRGAASHDTTPAYGPVAAALRSHLRAVPTAWTTAVRWAITSGCCCPSSGRGRMGSIPRAFARRSNAPSPRFRAGTAR